MNILMMTNTFTPHVGGVARSVEAFTAEYRRRGHGVLVVAPEFENMPADETGVIRVPAIQHFNGSDFSVVLPTPGFLTSALEEFRPNIIHSHHPFLLGATALRVAHSHALPLVFTHHTMYEQYTHYVPGDCPALKRFAVKLTTSYANLCDQVFAPSASIAAILRKRGCTRPLEVVPTGVRLGQFQQGDGPGFRAAMGIPATAFLVGHLGRLAPEKNLEFLARAVVDFLSQVPEAHFLIVGTGPSETTIRRLFKEKGLSGRLHCLGILEQPLLASAYHAMDLFAFASCSETQGMVLTEAMAAGTPVVALDAAGVREVVKDGENGLLLPATADTTAFVAALRQLRSLAADARARLREGARQTAQAFSLERSADKALHRYEKLCARNYLERHDHETWESMARLIGIEWEMLKGVADAAGAALGDEAETEHHS